MSHMGSLNKTLQGLKQNTVLLTWPWPAGQYLGPGPRALRTGTHTYEGRGGTSADTSADTCADIDTIGRALALNESRENNVSPGW